MGNIMNKSKLCHTLVIYHILFLYFLKTIFWKIVSFGSVVSKSAFTKCLYPRLVPVLAVLVLFAVKPIAGQWPVVTYL